MSGHVQEFGIMLKSKPYVPSGIQIGEVTDDDGTTLGILTFDMEEGEISVYINKQAADILKKAAGKLHDLLNKDS